MDILPIPEKPAFPVPKTRFVASQQWDCGPFLSYAHRIGALARVPPNSRYPGPSPDVPYLELIYPTPKEENEKFYQTWFYFGLIAECLDLNEGPDRSVPGKPDRATVIRECQSLYDKCVFEQDGQRYVSGSSVFDTLGPFLQMVREGGAPLASRLDHLLECLRLAYNMMNAIHSDFDDEIRFSIAALAEVISTAIWTACTVLAPAGTPRPDVARLVFPWYRLFLRPGGGLELDMIAHGWCPSEIERIRQLYQGLATMHFLSRLDRAIPGRDHSVCDKVMCNAFQIDMDTYQLSHASDGCSCPEYEINVSDVERVLGEPESFPVLRFDQCGSGGIVMKVEKYQPGMKYIALSHVSYLKCRDKLQYSQILGLGRRSGQPKT